MMNEQEFLAPLTPIEIRPVVYRLYYDDYGAPLFYSQEELPGNYIDIEPALYMNPPTYVKVVDGKLVILNTSIVKKLYPSQHGIPCHPQDISIVVKDTEPNIKWSLK